VTEPRPRHEIATDVDDLRADLEFEREELEGSIRHDYSTSETGIVPLDRRRPMWHFAGLWTTFVAGFSYMVLGFEIHDGGYSLAATAGIAFKGESARPPSVACSGCECDGLCCCVSVTDSTPPAWARM